MGAQGAGAEGRGVGESFLQEAFEYLSLICQGPGGKIGGILKKVN